MLVYLAMNEHVVQVNNLAWILGCFDVSSAVKLTR